jgi:hypothetical protein
MCRSDPSGAVCARGAQPPCGRPRTALCSGHRVVWRSWSRSQGMRRFTLVRPSVIRAVVPPASYRKLARRLGAGPGNSDSHEASDNRARTVSGSVDDKWAFGRREALAGQYRVEPVRGSPSSEKSVRKCPLDPLTTRTFPRERAPRACIDPFSVAELLPRPAWGHLAIARELRPRRVDLAPSCSAAPYGRRMSAGRFFISACRKRNRMRQTYHPGHASERPSKRVCRPFAWIARNGKGRLDWK